ncbi:organic hydroperoxide resistance protein [Christensenellaceae bacterium OttesenSCG-928-K19]|nr:organic hydroperoxide resistance protein [Christensenellaceae bacterium OttesenSCG-928-K19]
MKKLYSTTMINTGGRAGEVHAPDASLSLKIAPPGGGGDATNPEQLFAAGYAACFNSALSLVLQREKIKAESQVTAIVSLYEKEAFDYIVGVELEGHVEGVEMDKAQELMEKAHQVCPYSKATRGNIEVTLKVV